MSEKNLVVLSGKLASFFQYKNGRGSALIMVPEHGRAQNNFPRVYFDSDLMKIVSSMQVNDPVKVICQFVSRIVEKNGKRSVKSELEGIKVIPLRTVMEEEFGVKGKMFSGYENKAVFSGKIRSVKKVNDHILHVIVAQEKPLVTLMTTVFSKNADEDLAKYETGKEIKIVGSLQTARHEVDGKKVEYLNFAVSDVLVVE